LTTSSRFSPSLTLSAQPRLGHPGSKRAAYSLSRASSLAALNPEKAEKAETAETADGVTQQDARTNHWTRHLKTPRDSFEFNPFESPGFQIPEKEHIDFCAFFKCDGPDRPVCQPYSLEPDWTIVSVKPFVYALKIQLNRHSELDNSNAVLVPIQK